MLNCHGKKVSGNANKRLGLKSPAKHGLLMEKKQSSILMMSLQLLWLRKIDPLGSPRHEITVAAERPGVPESQSWETKVEKSLLLAIYSSHI